MKVVKTGVLVIAALLSMTPLFAGAQSNEQLQKQIDDNNAQIQKLNQEIAQYETQLKTTTTQKNTLQNKINQLDLQRKKLQTTINLTQRQISKTQVQITTLAHGITQKEATIGEEQVGLAESLRRLNASESQPLSLILLSTNNVSDLWRDIDAQGRVQDSVRQNIEQLADERRSLSESKDAAEQKNNQLISQKASLTEQQGSLNATRQSQADLLVETKKKESTYQQILAQKRAQEQAFEQALNDLQARLKAADTSSIPIAGSSVLSWPLNPVYITQYFGDTAFARTAAYKGKGHNGIDLRASIGTPVHAAKGGIVQAINLGTARNCQYGKWVLIKHDDGLTTLYAHLSNIAVSSGESVGEGDTIGYAGDTGYATGPHLHFTVYVSSSVSFTQYRCNTGQTVMVPVAPFNGYLNPMLYLPALP